MHTFRPGNDFFPRHSVVKKTASRAFPSADAFHVLKTSKLQQEADAAERNQASLRLMLQELPSWFQDKEYLATFQDARRMLAMRYRHKSNTVLGRIVLSIHETGHLRRRKIKGCGSFNMYGSEGPPSRGQGRPAKKKAIDLLAATSLQT